MPQQTEYLSPKATAKLLQVHTTTIYSWVKSGKLRAFRRAGTRLRIARADVESLLVPVVPAVPVPTSRELEQRQVQAERQLKAAGIKF
jgi:excisionase family DNA binding protein